MRLCGEEGLSQALKDGQNPNERMKMKEGVPLPPPKARACVPAPEAGLNRWLEGVSIRHSHKA